MNFKLTLNQKRFLIVWTCFHSFALFTYFANIDGELARDKTTSGKYIYTSLFRTYNDNSDFWPMTTYYWEGVERTNNQPVWKTDINGKSELIDNYDVVDTRHLNGIFNSYDYTEYIFYMIIGFAIVYLPKIWSD